MIFLKQLLLCSSAALIMNCQAADNVLTVQADRPGIQISPTLYGIFFEEINHAGDGVIYTELIRNRSFEDAKNLEHWSLLVEGSAKADLTVEQAKPLNFYNLTSAKIDITQYDSGRVSLVNHGYWGISVSANAVYQFSVCARGSAQYDEGLTISIKNKNREIIASGTLGKLSQNWKEYALELKANRNDSQAHIEISFNKKGTVWLDMVSLFPKETWKGRANGLRTDLAQMLEGLRPAFVRFPGGCWVEGNEMKTAYRWKETIGPVSQRRNQYNLWQYHSTHGLGFLEYLIMCEDLGAEPLFVINCGMSHREVVPQEQMGQFIQDALDAIEYANAPTNTVWGSMRAKHGHPAPFNLKYLEIGNENGGPAYNERYAMIYDAVKNRYPQINLVANDWGGLPSSRPIEIVDEHYYSSPEFFINNAGKYDKYDRKGHKVYVGEYAVTQGCGQGNLRAAVGEAAFMTGMERNSDVVILASYAPLFANVNYKKWNPDLINFDSAKAYGTPSYYVQKMFSENIGVQDIPVSIHLAEPLEPEVQKGKIGLGTWTSQAEYKDIRVTRGEEVLYSADFSKDMQGFKTLSGDWATKDGVLRQSSNRENVQAVAGDDGWFDYTLSLKARKVGGAEGFLIMFHVRDAQNWCWWNLGGWGNQRHAIEKCEGGGKSIMGKEAPGKIETGRWYDIQIVLKGKNVKCYLDGKLLHDADYAYPKPLYASASQTQAKDEIILKVVNASKIAQPSQINLEGVAGVGPKAKVQLLTSEDPMAENSVSQPNKVMPVSSTVEPSGKKIQHVFPANSVTVIRFPITR